MPVHPGGLCNDGERSFAFGAVHTCFGVMAGLFACGYRIYLRSAPVGSSLQAFRFVRRKRRRARVRRHSRSRRHRSAHPATSDLSSGQLAASGNDAPHCSIRHSSRSILPPSMRRGKTSSMSDPIRRALISVFDKTGLAELGRFLAEHGIEVLSSGGSARTLAEAGVPAIEIAAYTGFPEIMDGRVKTLQPRIHGGLLAVRGDPEHERAMKAHDIRPIDLLVVNLYPFEAAAAKDAAFDTCIENIDIGGPALIRAAAKNHAFVTVVVDPADYRPVIDEIAANGATTP